MSKRRTAEGAAVSQRVQVAFGNRLRAARKASRDKRVNQDDLAAELDVTRTSVSNIERGRHRVFLDQVYIAAKALGVEVIDLLPTVDEVFTDTLSTGQSMRPEAARDLSALVGSLRDRALREVHGAEADAVNHRHLNRRSLK